MTIAAKQEWCPLCNMVHEPNLHIHEQVSDMKEDIKKLYELAYIGIYCNIDSSSFDKYSKELEQFKNKYNV